MNNITDTVKQLIIINIIFFVGSILVGEATSLDILSLQFIENPKFQYWQLLTHRIFPAFPDRNAHVYARRVNAYFI